jgi:hypothetical protein
MEKYKRWAWRNLFLFFLISSIIIFIITLTLFLSFLFSDEKLKVSDLIIHLICVTCPMSMIYSFYVVLRLIDREDNGFFWRVSCFFKNKK